jgi:transcriptional regulator with XRE-family HTH domain
VDDKQAKRLGSYLRRQRTAMGLSTRQLAELARIDDSTVVRFEQGAYASPAPDKLARIAEALDLPLADVFAHAHYALPRDLPNLPAYLRVKYRHLPPSALVELDRYLKRLGRKYGIDTDGPAPGEDEKP